eukprot:jgi/Galph1/5405/GphlegSOOS_G4087.1
MAQVDGKQLHTNSLCPLCMEELDMTDLSLKPCLCGYQVCLYCLHYIREQQNGQCPGCRTPYSEENFTVRKIDTSAFTKWNKKKTNKKEEKVYKMEKNKNVSQRPKDGTNYRQHTDGTNWRNMRIIQRNLIRILGLPPSLSRTDIIKREDMFGGFGKLTRILVDRGRWWIEQSSGSSGGVHNTVVYLLFDNSLNALKAVKSINNQLFHGSKIEAAVATTKYCNAFLEAGKPQWCSNPYCLYRHEAADPADILSVEEMYTLQLAPPPPHYLFSNRKARSDSLSRGHYPNSARPRGNKDNGVFVESIESGTNGQSPSVSSSGWSPSADSDEFGSLEDNIMLNYEDEEIGENIWKRGDQWKNGLLGIALDGSYMNGDTTENLSNDQAFYEHMQHDSLQKYDQQSFAMSSLLGDMVTSPSDWTGNVYSTNVRMSSRFNFNESWDHEQDNENNQVAAFVEEEEHSIEHPFDLSDDKLSYQDSVNCAMMMNSQEVSNEVNNKEETLTPEQRLEMMFGNDVVNHLVSLDTLPSLNELLKSLHSSTVTRKNKDTSSVIDHNGLNRMSRLKKNEKDLDDTVEKHDTQQTIQVEIIEKEPKDKQNNQTDDNLQATSPMPLKKSQKKKKEKKQKRDAERAERRKISLLSNMIELPKHEKEQQPLPQSSEHESSAHDNEHLDEIVLNNVVEQEKTLTSSREENNMNAQTTESSSNEKLSVTNKCQAFSNHINENKQLTSEKIYQELLRIQEKESELQSRLENLETKLQALLVCDVNE